MLAGLFAFTGRRIARNPMPFNRFGGRAYVSV
jgi:hypothetical protein